MPRNRDIAQQSKKNDNLEAVELENPHDFKGVSINVCFNLNGEKGLSDWLNHAILLVCSRWGPALDGWTLSAQVGLPVIPTEATGKTSKDVFIDDMGVSWNGGTQKWMVFKEKILLEWMIWGYPYFRKPPCGDRCSVIFRFETRMVIVVFHGHDQCHSDRQECHGRRDFRWSFSAKCWRVGTMCKICIVYGARSWCTNGPKQRAILGVSSHPRFGPSIWPNAYSQETHVWLESGWLETLENRPSPHPGGPFFFLPGKEVPEQKPMLLGNELAVQFNSISHKARCYLAIFGPPWEMVSRTLDAALIKKQHLLKDSWRFSGA